MKKRVEREGKYGNVRKGWKGDERVAGEERVGKVKKE
jgi:hypothetical protein